jgi:hypothetical protein
VNKNHCVTAKVEVMPYVLKLAKEYQLMHPMACWADAQGAAYIAFRLECQRQTIAFKEAMFDQGVI